MDTLQLTRGAVAAFRCVVPARLPASPSPPSSSLLLRDKMQSPRCSTEELPRAGGAGGGGQEPPGLQGRVAGPGAATRDAGAWRRGDEIERPQPIGTAPGSWQAEDVSTTNLIRTPGWEAGGGGAGAVERGADENF